MPAWIEHNGEQQALTPGTALHQGDILTTGSSARVLIRLAEGSFVKLGENGQLHIKTLQPPEQNNGIFAALLRVARGAFRFTTTELGKKRRRDVKVRIGAITAGIRGTDIWGRSNGDKDLLCLIEGKITTQYKNEPAFDMNSPLTFYIVPKNQPPLPVTPVPADKLARWAEETDLQNGTGVVSTKGHWAVNIMSLQSQASAEKFAQKLARDGYATNIEQAKINHQNWWRVRVNGFRSEQDALAFAHNLDNHHGIRQPWVVKF